MHRRNLLAGCRRGHRLRPASTRAGGVREGRLRRDPVRARRRDRHPDARRLAARREGARRQDGRPAGRDDGDRRRAEAGRGAGQGAGGDRARSRRFRRGRGIQQHPAGDLPAGHGEQDDPGQLQRRHLDLRRQRLQSVFLRDLLPKRPDTRDDGAGRAGFRLQAGGGDRAELPGRQGRRRRVREPLQGRGAGRDLRAADPARLLGRGGQDRRRQAGCGVRLHARRPGGKPGAPVPAGGAGGHSIPVDLHGGRGDPAGAGRCGARLLQRGRLGAEPRQSAQPGLREGFRGGVQLRARELCRAELRRGGADRYGRACRQRGPCEQGGAAGGDGEGGFSPPSGASSTSGRTTSPCRISG